MPSQFTDCGYVLQTSKTLNYLDSIIIGPYFGSFIAIWIYLRHYLNLKILWATLTEFRTVGPYELNWDTQQYKCWISQIITFSLLASLQAINLFWLYLILRILRNYVFNSVRQDERSDNEDEEEEEETSSPAKPANGSTALPNGENQGRVTRRQAAKTNTPRVFVNGEPMDSINGSVSGKK